LNPFTNQEIVMKKFNLSNIPLLLILLVLSVSSCIPLKDYVYLQGATDEKNQQSIVPAAPTLYKLQANDNLYIQVISNDELSGYFNLSSTDRYLNNDAAIEIGSYRVNHLGEIEFPYLGAIKVAGHTVDEIKALIDKGISSHLIQYSVIVKLVNRNITLLGEFNNPGTYSFYKDYLTIFEAIGIGSDLTDFANRHKIKVIRHYDGNKIIKTLDLTKAEIIGSDFYFLLPNDIVYVEPTSRIYGAKTLPFTAILTTINTSILIYNAIANAIRK
jgi:polysaccharide biosynthesis/export protein